MKEEIICFEGPSSVGKTTLSELLSETFTIVPEVNLLFQKPEKASEYWYHEMQIERYNLSKQSSRHSILDGDIFQPIWYNWVCGYPSEFLSKQETHDFYRTKIKEGKIRFPDLYIIFDVEEKELRKRKENDITRKRRNFEKHLKIIAPLRRYYRFLEEQTAIEVKFIQFGDIDKTKLDVLNAIENLTTNRVDQEATFAQIVQWIENN